MRIRSNLLSGRLVAEGVLDDPEVRKQMEACSKLAPSGRGGRVERMSVLDALDRAAEGAYETDSWMHGEVAALLRELREALCDLDLDGLTCIDAAGDEYGVPHDDCGNCRLARLLSPTGQPQEEVE